MMAREIRVGVIGANVDRGWASRTHLPVLKLLDEYEIAAVCTTRQESADEAASKFGASRAYDDFRKLAADPDIDLAVVCVRVDRHLEPVMVAIEGGKHVFCEWPLGHSTAEAETMTKAAAMRGVVTQVGLQTRLSPVIRYAGDLIRQGFIGSLRSVTATSATAQWGGQLTSEFAYGADDGIGVNVYTIHASHLIDTLTDLLGGFGELSSTLTNIRRETLIVDTGATVPFTSPDQLVVNGRLANGAVVAMHLQSGIAGRSGLQIDIRGTDADLIITSTGHIPTGDLMLSACRRGGDTEVLPVPADYLPEILRPLPQAAANVAQAYQKLAVAIREGGKAAPSFADALAHHRLMDGIRMAAETGERLKLS
jgi:predicted dehydrogenase